MTHWFWTGLNRRTCVVTNDEASKSKDTKGRHSCVFWMFSGVLRSFCSECFYVFTKGAVRMMLLCVVPGNHSCQRLATAEKWQMGVVFQDRCLCCSLGVPEWIHYTTPILQYSALFVPGWSSSPDIILLQLLIVASKGNESSHKAAHLGKAASSISIKQSLKTWRACLLPTIKLLDISAQNCHVVDWFRALIKTLLRVWDEALICQLKRKLTLISQLLIDPSEMSNSNSLIFLYVIEIDTFYGLLAPLHPEPSTTGTSEKAKEFYHNPGLNTNEARSSSNHIQISITRGLDIKLKNTRHHWNYRRSWHRREGKGWGSERSGDSQPKYGINTKHFATEPFGDCEVKCFNTGTESESQIACDVGPVGCSNSKPAVTKSFTAH